MPLHAATGCGGFHRRVPTGGAAYGMPLKLRTPSAAAPETRPLSIRTSSLAAASDRQAPATASAAIDRNGRRNINDLLVSSAVALNLLLKIELRLQQMRALLHRVAEIHVGLGLEGVRRPLG